MQSIYALEKEKTVDNLSYWWLLFLMPVLVAGGWYLWWYSGFVERLSQTWGNIQNYYRGVNEGFADAFARLKGITISPLVILIFLAILSLLVIEDIFRKSRHKVGT